MRVLKPPQCRGRDGHRSAGPSSRRLVDKIGINVLRPEIFKLPVGLVTPAQEFAYYPAPNLHCPWEEAALIAHPSHILVKYALVPNDVWFAPLTEKTKPRSSDVDYPLRRGGRPIWLLTLGRYPSECLYIDALWG